MTKKKKKGTKKEIGWRKKKPINVISTSAKLFFFFFAKFPPWTTTEKARWYSQAIIFIIRWFQAVAVDIILKQREKRMETAGAPSTTTTKIKKSIRFPPDNEEMHEIIGYGGGMEARFSPEESSEEEEQESGEALVSLRLKQLKKKEWR